MPTRQVVLTEELDRFVSTSVESGRYGDPSDVIRAALQDLEHKASLNALRDAVDEGDNSGIAEPGVFARVRSGLALTEPR